MLPPPRYVVVQCGKCGLIQARDLFTKVYGKPGPHKTVNCYACGKPIEINIHTVLASSDDAETIRETVRLQKEIGRRHK